MNGAAGRRERLGRIIGSVIRQAVRDARAEGVLLLDAAAPESPLARDWCTAALGEDRVVATAPAGRWLGVYSACKTTLLLSAPPAAALLPLGDLYGSQLRALAGAWVPPPAVAVLAEAAGGVELLDGALRRWLEERREQEEAFRSLPPDVARELRAALEANRFGRRSCGLVPKLTGRTLGVDLWE